MIMWIPQLISGGIHMKSEIPLDHAAPGARGPRVSRRALTVTTRHSVNGIGRRLTMVPPAPWAAERPNRLRLLQLPIASVALPSPAAP